MVDGALLLAQLRLVAESVMGHLWVDLHLLPNMCVPLVSRQFLPISAVVELQRYGLHVSAAT